MLTPADFAFSTDTTPLPATLERHYAIDDAATLPLMLYAALLPLIHCFRAAIMPPFFIF